MSAFTENNPICLVDPKGLLTETVGKEGTKQGSQKVPCPCDENRINDEVLNASKRVVWKMNENPVWHEGVPFRREWCTIVCCQPSGAVYSRDPQPGTWDHGEAGEVDWKDIPVGGTATCANRFGPHTSTPMECLMREDVLVRYVHSHPDESDFSGGDEGFCKASEVPLVLARRGYMPCTMCFKDGKKTVECYNRRTKQWEIIKEKLATK